MLDFETGGETMRKKSLFVTFLLAFSTLSTIGCTSSTQPAVIPVVLDDQKVSLEFHQDNAAVAASNHNHRLLVTLKPEPFTIRINGDKDIVSITALNSEELASPLLQSSGPWVAPIGTGNVVTKNNLYLSYLSLDFFAVNADTLKNLSVYTFSPEESIAMANTLKDQFGAEPLALLSARSYLLEPDQDFFIKTINGNDIQSGDSFFLLVFIQKQSADPFFYILQWIPIRVEFR